MMHSLSGFSVLALLLGLLVCAAPGPRSCDTELCGSKFLPTRNLVGDSLFERHDPKAELSPRVPSHCHHLPNRKSDDSGVPYCAVIQVLRKDNGASLGYISKNTFFQAQYRVQPDISDAVVVNFTVHNVHKTHTGVDLLTVNSDIPNYFYLGLVQGRDDVTSILHAGSYQYAYIANTNPTPPDSPPQNVGNSYTQATGRQRTSESAVWTLDVSAGTITPVWTNPDGTQPPIQIFLQSTAVYISGDAGQFNARYPAPITFITLKLVTQ
ncbi:uncharacterized protein EI90DRAFT_1401404 [Cantharellus anzutake]|uniref:uncharacterized protein n=1 Tax=Cantharellus anzutake TaxID=1750568 RepID=UPI0019051072|nr:uncharacterized protein EI90DRAFT_1401404 [Cantharellus anzutake]KAF8329469.1 hypothetical protein EI90DRAFT_1401404 [Cantharellus anzutake]